MVANKNTMSLKARILFIVSLAAFITAGIAISGFLYFNSNTVETAIHETQVDIIIQLKGAADFVAHQGGLKDAIDKIKNKYTSPDQISESDRETLMNQVPIVAAMKIGKKTAADVHMQFRVFSDQPRNKENLATAEELEILKRFEDNPQITQFKERVGDDMIVYHAVRLKKDQGCLNCHGDPKTSPWGNGKDILGFQMENWTDGKLHGVFKLTQSKKYVQAAAAGDGFLGPIGWLISFIVIGGLISLVLAAYLTQAPIKAIQYVTSLLFESSAKLNDVSIKIASSSEQLSASTTQQAASLEETASSIEELTSMVGKNSENSKSSLQAAEDSKSQAEQGQQIVQQMIESMNEISQSNNEIMTQINESNTKMNEIVQVIQEIGNKTKVINDIVFQTKLLSFNASVEAARAGEHGKGFAVVAEEVGNLAQMSGNAAKEIADMLTASITKVENIAKDTQAKVEKLILEGQQKIQTGTEISQQCGEVLNSIVANVSSVSSLASEISVATQEQSQGISEINQAMNQMDQVTQQNAAAGQEAANAGDMLAQQSEKLKLVVDSLVAAVNGGNSQDSYDHTSHSQQTKDSDVKPEQHKSSANQVSAQKNIVQLDSKRESKSNHTPKDSHPGFKSVNH